MAMRRFKSGMRSIVPGREKRLAGIAVDHRPEERAKDKQDSDHPDENGGVRENQNFREDKTDAENEECDHLPACETREIVAEEK